jgi:ketosteroid isomerase-like protein
MVQVARFLSVMARDLVLAIGLLICLVSSVRADDRQNTQSLVQNFIKSWETNDVALFSATLHDDVVFSFPGDRLDKQQLVNLFRTYHQEKKNIKIYLWDQFFVAGDKFFTAYQFAATDRVKDKRQAVGTGVMGRIKDGKIILFKEYYDNEVASHQYADELPLDEGVVSPWPASIWLRPDTID